MHLPNHAHQSDRPKRSVHQLFSFDHCGVLVEGDSSELSDHIVVYDQAHRNFTNEQVESHLFDLISLHVGLHCRSHDVMCWVKHHKTVQLVCPH